MIVRGWKDIEIGTDFSQWVWGYYFILFWGAENVLDPDRGGGCTTL